MSPNQPKTPHRTFRAGAEYDEAQRIAKARSENLSEHVLRPAIRAYIERNTDGSESMSAPSDAALRTAPLDALQAERHKAFQTGFWAGFGYEDSADSDDPLPWELPGYPYITHTEGDVK